jgi:hypothetical protein
MPTLWTLSVPSSKASSSMKMGQSVPITLAFKLQAPGNNPEESRRHEGTIFKTALYPNA